MPEDLIEQEERDALLEECRDKVEAIETDLMDVLDRKAEPSAEIVNRIFRAFHSVKGAASYLRYDPLQRLSHLAEDVLSQIRDGRLELSALHAQALLSALGRMRQMVLDRGEGVVECTQEASRLKAILRGHEKPPTPTCLPQRKLRMLIVEDDFSSRAVLQGLLSRFGNCDIAVNGKEAVEAFRSALESGKAYDLVCMDIRMPEMDGKEAVKQIRSIEERADIFSSSGVKIFMTTGILDVRTVVSSFKALCDAYLYKPIDGAKLNDHLLSFRLISKKGVASTANQRRNAP